MLVDSWTVRIEVVAEQQQKMEVFFWHQLALCALRVDEVERRRLSFDARFAIQNLVAERMRMIR